MFNSASATTINEGTLQALSDQALEAVAGAEAIAIWTTSGNILFTNPEDPPARLKAAMQPRPDTLPDYLKPLRTRSSGLRLKIFDFAIQDASSKKIRGCLSIAVKKKQRPKTGKVAMAIKPIIDCLIRQMDINDELTSAQKLAIAEQRNANFLHELTTQTQSDVLAKNAGNIIKACISELGCTDGAILVPDQGLKVIEAGHNSLLDPAKSQILANKMLTAIETEKRVVVATIQLDDYHGDSASMLGCPVLDTKDRVIGLLCVTTRHAINKEKVRLVRTACSRLSSLLRAMHRSAQDRMSRGELIEYIDAYIQRKPSSHASLFYLDLDNLHIINDSFGHSAGDQAIEHILELLQDLIPQTDTVVHLSSDRFVVFYTDCGVTLAEQHGKAILSAFQQHAFEFQGKKVELTTSIGVAVIPMVATNASGALSIAEVACRGAKERGGNRVALFKDMDASMVQRRSDLDQIGYLQNALLTNRFIIYSQLIAPLSGDTAGQRHELLIRMLDKNDELMPPDRFLSAAERYQLMPAIDRWVIKHALQQIGSVDNVLEINLASFSINVSAQSLADSNFLKFVENELHQSHVSPDSICFEITETAAVRNLEQANHFINRLQRIGCRFALDDFGTGYSSFAYLKNLPVQYIKIDGAFIRDLIENPISEAIVQAATGIGHVMGAAVVAEHVENDLVLQKLRALNVNFAQGYGIGKPRPLEDLLNEIDAEMTVGTESASYTSTMTLRVAADGKLVTV